MICVLREKGDRKLDNKDFKKIVNEIFKEYGFNRNKKCFYKDYGEIYLKFDLQKSNYSNGWYINYSIIIKDLHADEEVLDNWEQDLSGRVIFKPGKQSPDLMDLDNVGDIEQFKLMVHNGISGIICMIEQGGLKHYINNNPKMICTASIWAQEYMLEKEYIKKNQRNS